MPMPLFHTSHVIPIQWSGVTATSTTCFISTQSINETVPLRLRNAVPVLSLSWCVLGHLAHPNRISISYTVLQLLQTRRRIRPTRLQKMEMNQYLFGYEWHFLCDQCPGAAWYLNRTWIHSVVTMPGCATCTGYLGTRTYARWT